MPSFTDLLAAAGLDADTSPRRLAEYSYDASNYRVPPAAVVFPRSAGDVLGVLDACRATGTPLTARGGGTGMAGSAIGSGVVLDFSRHLNALGAVDEDGGTVQAGAGAVLSRLTDHVERATGGRLTFAPDPSSRTRATVGGALGNDACGNHSVRHGRTSDHVAELDLVTADGFRLTAGRGFLRATDPDDAAAAARAARLAEELETLARENLAPLRTELERIPRQVSGYHLAALLPEHGFDVARALVGSEGTCAVVVGARMRLVEKPASALLVCLGYADVVDAARDVPEILTFNPAAVEGIDDAIVQTMRFRRGADSVTGLPNGKAWLYVDLDGEDPDQVRAQADALLGRLRAAGRLMDGRAVPDPAERASLWRVREDGAGLSSRLHTGGESWPGWEDSAVAPDRLADYLADFRLLLERHGLQGVMYGHFGAGCMHIRITYDLRSEAGRAVFRAFSRDAAELVVAHGGSLSGEHGDGRARSEFLPVMYSPRMLELFSRFRRIWDPTGLLNPGAPTDPPPIDADLALAGVPDRQWRTHFELHPRGAGQRVPTGHDPGSAPAGLDDWTHAVQGCIGVGRCRTDAGGFMCPSYRATRDEKDSTRGRARVLQEMVRGARTVEEGWRSPEVLESLDLCLSCKACSTDCPVGVDMATYKAEFLSHHYRGRLRPASHYSLGWLPRWLRLAGPIAPLVNAALATPLRKLAPLAGVTAARPLPDFAPASAWRKAVHDAGAQPARSGPPGAGPTATPGVGSPEAGAPALATDVEGSAADTAGAEETGVVLFVDTFTRGFRPEVAGAAARVLAAGGRVECAADACCGLTWITTGQLGTAKKKLAGAAAALDDGTQRPIVVVEPSCAAALRKDLPELVPTDQARRVAARVRSFAAHAGEMAAAGRLPEPAAALPGQVVLQTHCHEYATFGAGVQRKVLEAAGVAVREASGCCGVAGNFGFEAEHFGLSMQVAEQSFAPALRETGAEAPVLTDGFSCSRQAAQLDPGRPGRHLAQLLDPGP
ncbi:FAD-binding and (Fe-S)-binding domain-containing protein [Arthrobacter ginkgonis]|uniref:FAD-binding and (Fe-S)-binding domain-containing protein n=1 Tax=Arthrobacter ginkgonis TaxID=1630594 RepID=A0ABP7C378_9MICC